MPKCRECKTIFDGVYRQKYCSHKCRLFYQTVKNEETGCIERKRSASALGYTVLNINNKTVLSHRLSYKLAFGDFDESLFVCHKCDNPSCINPDHLFLGTAADNAADMASKGRAAWAKRKMPKEMRDKISETRRKSGWKPSPKQIEASKIALAKKFQDPEWVKAKSDKMRGENNPFYGKPMSQERREKLQAYWDSMRGVKRPKLSEEVKEKMRQSARLRVQRQKEEKAKCLGL
jgi:hypothetical protein